MSDDKTRLVRDVTARGARMRVVEAGQGPPLVLVHDFLTSHRDFDRVFPSFVANFRVIAPDLPGFGGSEKPSPKRYAYGIETFSEAIADLVAALGAGRVALIGHGLGGAVALTLAASHPELVRRMLLIAPLCFPLARPPTTRIALVPFLGGVVFKQLYGRAFFRSHFRDVVYGRGASVPASRIDAHYDAFNAPSARESAYAVLRTMLDTRAVVARLSRIVTPTLIVWGRRDRLLLPSTATRMVRQIQGARLRVLDAGHAPHDECRDEFVEIASSFLAERR